MFGYILIKKINKDIPPVAQKVFKPGACLPLGSFEIDNQKYKIEVEDILVLYTSEGPVVFQPEDIEIEFLN